MTEEQILNKEIAKVKAMKTEAMLAGKNKEDDIYKELSKEFPPEAYTKDNSRGFDLTSLKAQYVVERLNEVLGVMNWTFGGQFKEINGGVLYEGVLIVNVEGRENRQTAPGFSAIKKNVGDTYKSAQTDSLCKCASKFGVGNSVFKGLVAPPGSSSSKPASSNSSSDKKSDEPAPFAKRKRSRPSL